MPDKLIAAGLEVLVRLDSRFKPFAQSLFSRSSLTVTRDQLTKEENEQLDRSLRAFLQLLSNHLLTPAAFQVLEYCIRRNK
jgi:U3 small nucleolar RNA-associated protein 10